MKAKEIAEKFLVKKTKVRKGNEEKEIVLRERMYIFDGIKEAFGIKDDTEITETQFKEMLNAFLKSKSHETPKLQKEVKHQAKGVNYEKLMQEHDQDA